jgi:hypothetical protein
MYAHVAFRLGAAHSQLACRRLLCRSQVPTAGRLRAASNRPPASGALRDFTGGGETGRSARREIGGSRASRRSARFAPDYASRRPSNAGRLLKTNQRNDGNSSTSSPGPVFLLGLPSKNCVLALADLPISPPCMKSVSPKAPESVSPGRHSHRLAGGRGPGDQGRLCEEGCGWAAPSSGSCGALL